MGALTFPAAEWPFKRRQPPPAEVGVKKYVGLNMRKHVDGQMEILHDTPYAVLLPSTIQRGVSEGWITLEDGPPVPKHYPAGPPGDNEWVTSHTFLEYPSVTFITKHGNVKYRMVSQPGKRPDGEVVHHYLADREG